MPTVRIAWTDINADEEGHYVYRDTSPLDLENLPAPLATLGPDVTQYDDATASADTTYYYAVAAYKGSYVAVVDAGVITTGGTDWGSVAIGDYVEGGVYAGIITYADARQFHIVSGLASSEVRDIFWKTSETSTTGTSNADDGASNVDSMVAAGIDDHPAAKHCINYTGGGNNDWYMPAINEMQLLLDNLVSHAEFADLVASEQFSWSSTENSGTRARGVWFSSPDSTVNPFKSRVGTSVRPIRRVPV